MCFVQNVRKLMLMAAPTDVQTAAFLGSGYACPNSKFIKSQGALSGLSADYQRFPLGLRLDSKTMFSGTSAIFIFGSLSVLM